MTYIWQRWLAKEFREAGLKVVEVEGWQNRGRPASTGHFDPRQGVTVHHTATTTSRERPAPTLGLLISGRPDLPGPLCQWSVGYDGTVYVIAAGRANHAGPIGKSGQPGMPVGGDGNALALGDEVDTNGSQALSPEQIHAIAVTNKVALAHYNNGVERVHRHADISGSGKWDLGSRNTAQLREDVKAASLTNQEDDMPSPAEFWAHEIPVGPDQKVPAQLALRQARADANRGRVAAQAAASVARDALRGQADLARLIKALPDTSVDLQALADDIVTRTAEAVERLDAAAVAENLEITVKDDGTA